MRLHRHFLCITLWILGCSSELAAQSPISSLSSAFDNLEACNTALRMPIAPSTDATDSLRVTSWNTKKLSLPGAEELLAELALGSDLLLLQEAIHNDLTAADALPRQVFAEGYVDGDQISGVEIRSVAPPNLSCSLSFTEPWLRTPKAIAVARIAFDQGQLLVVNIHAINFTLGSGALSAQLEAIGDLLRGHKGPALVAGDFNDWNPWRELVLAQFAKRQNLVEVTFSPDWRSQHFGRTVDGFLLRDLVWSNATAIPTTSSDHHPIGVTLRSMPLQLMHSDAGGSAQKSVQ